jgi:hypothetical protein
MVVNDIFGIVIARKFITLERRGGFSTFTVVFALEIKLEIRAKVILERGNRGRVNGRGDFGEVDII